MILCPKWPSQETACSWLIEERQDVPLLASDPPFLTPNARMIFFGRSSSRFIFLALYVLLTIGCARPRPVPPGPYGWTPQPPPARRVPGAPVTQPMVFICNPPNHPVQWYVLELFREQSGFATEHITGIKPDYSIDCKLHRQEPGCYKARAKPCEYSYYGEEQCAPWCDYIYFSWPLPRRKKCIVPCILYPLLLMEKGEKQNEKDSPTSPQLPVGP